MSENPFKKPDLKIDSIRETATPLLLGLACLLLIIAAVPLLYVPSAIGLIEYEYQDGFLNNSTGEQYADLLVAQFETHFNAFANTEVQARPTNNGWRLVMSAIGIVGYLSGVAAVLLGIKGTKNKWTTRNDRKGKNN